jgi:predicted GNAT family acetyltransferase
MVLRLIVLVASRRVGVIDGQQASRRETLGIVANKASHFAYIIRWGDNAVIHPSQHRTPPLKRRGLAWVAAETSQLYERSMQQKSTTQKIQNYMEALQMATFCIQVNTIKSNANLIVIEQPTKATASN